jgi:putative transposase
MIVSLLYRATRALRGQRPPDALAQPPAAAGSKARRLLRTAILGGVINECSYAS